MLQVPNELIIGIFSAAAPSSGPEQWASWPNQKEKKEYFWGREEGVWGVWGEQVKGSTLSVVSGVWRLPQRLNSLYPREAGCGSPQSGLKRSLAFLLLTH